MHPFSIATTLLAATAGKDANSCAVIAVEDDSGNDNVVGDRVNVGVTDDIVIIDDGNGNGNDDIFTEGNVVNDDENDAIGVAFVVDVVVVGTFGVSSTCMWDGLKR